MDIKPTKTDTSLATRVGDAPPCTCGLDASSLSTKEAIEGVTEQIICAMEEE